MLCYEMAIITYKKGTISQLIISIIFMTISANINIVICQRHIPTTTTSYHQLPSSNLNLKPSAYKTFDKYPSSDDNLHHFNLMTNLREQQQQQQVNSRRVILQDGFSRETEEGDKSFVNHRQSDAQLVKQIIPEESKIISTENGNKRNSFLETSSNPEIIANNQLQNREVAILNSFLSPLRITFFENNEDVDFNNNNYDNKMTQQQFKQRKSLYNNNNQNSNDARQMASSLDGTIKSHILNNNNYNKNSRIALNEPSGRMIVIPRDRDDVMLPDDVNNNLQQQQLRISSPTPPFVNNNNRIIGDKQDVELDNNDDLQKKRVNIKNPLKCVFNIITCKV